jgi:hypothetical protein
MTIAQRGAVALTLWFISASTLFAAANVHEDVSHLRANFAGDVLQLRSGRSAATVRLGDRFGAWTVMAIVRGDHSFVVLEDFTSKTGAMAIVDANGLRFRFAKTAEASAVDPTTLFRGHAQREIETSDKDLLANEILAQPSDPTYDDIAPIFPPLQKIRNGTFNFVGTPHTSEKIGFSIGGRTSYFDPAVYEPSIRRVRDGNAVWHGLVGGDLPVLRFVYPDTDNSWTELLAFAPFRIVNNNTHVQPVWYRTTRIERGLVVWSRYNDSYQLFPPRIADDDSGLFYADLMQLKSGWDTQLQSAMTIDVPDKRISSMARASLMRAMMTRVNDFPKYGAVEKDYGGNEHDGFLDTFNVDTATMVDWGLLEHAERYIDNYFSNYVREDGSILYRGPETGQFGRVLTVLAQYANASGKHDVLLKHRARIEAVTNLLRSLRTKALQLPTTNPDYGLLAGWSEADSALDPDPSRYMQPYFSNSTEAARGFRDLGRVWQSIGTKLGDTKLVTWGNELESESIALRKDIETALSRSRLTIDGIPVLPAIAGVREPFHVAMQRDRLDPQHRSYRAYMEMLHSGSLSATDVRAIVDYRANHHDVLLGIPTAYGFGTYEVAGFLLYGHVYGLIQHDMIREALLATYSDLAHQYTRGMWLAPETRRPLLNEDAAPYCSPAQLIAPMLIRWLLVFEDPESDVLWLGKAIPRDWLTDGKHVTVKAARTKWGRVDYSIESRMKRKIIEVKLQLPPHGITAETRLRLRAPDEARIKYITINGKRSTQFDVVDEAILIAPGTGGELSIVAYY